MLWIEVHAHTHTHTTSSPPQQQQRVPRDITSGEHRDPREGQSTGGARDTRTESGTAYIYIYAFTKENVAAVKLDENKSRNVKERRRARARIHTHHTASETPAAGERRTCALRSERRESAPGELVLPRLQWSTRRRFATLAAVKAEAIPKAPPNRRCALPVQRGLLPPCASNRAS